MKILPDIERLLRATIGLDVQSMGASCVACIVRERMAARGVLEEVHYLDLVTASDQERDELIERIVVPETWFFRDGEPFRMVQKYVTEEWLPKRPAAPLSLLSLPCSTGEEPYSLAMALFDIGLDAGQFRIEAYDISRASLQIARQARYGKHSFRAADLSFRDRYFHGADGGYVLNDTVRESVVFARGNILDPGFAAARGPYDVIFFRNLMIYFDRIRQKQSLAAIERLLADTGLLFVGHAEPSLLMERWFSSVRYPFAFAYRKHDDERRRRGVASTPSSYSGPQRRMPCAQAPVANPPAPKAQPVRAASPVSGPVGPGDSEPLAQAREHADRGRFEAARCLCEGILRREGPNPDAYYLLGLIDSACGRGEQAEAWFHKAVYLEPHHYHSLTHLALAAARRGDTRSADVLRRRARRAEALRGAPEA